MLPLTGITVIEWGEDLATALCGMMLADFGADVLLIEPTEGSEGRKFTPPFVKGESALFLTLNRGKKSIAIDVSAVEGRRILGSLSEKADVLLESVGPKGLRSVGLGYESLQKSTPSLIVYSINAYGTHGWYAGEQAGELEAQASTGLNYLGHYTKPPVRVGADAATTMAALCACQAILAALLERVDSHLGQRGETSLLDGWAQAVGFLTTHWSADVDEWMNYSHTGPWSIEDLGFQTKDLPISFRLGAPITKFQKDRWITFCRAMGLDHLIEDPWWFEHAALTIDFPMLTRETYEVALKKHSAAEVIDFVHKIGGVAAPVLDHSRIWSHPQTVALEPRTTSPLPGGGSVAHLRAPWHFSQTPLNRRDGPPAVGQHTEEMLQELGYSDQEITLLSQKGVVRYSQRD